MADQAPAQSPAAPVVVRRRVVLGSGTASAPLQPPTFRQGTTIDVNALNPQSRRVRRRRADSEDDEAPLSSSAPAHDGRAAPHSANVAEKSSRKHTAPQSSTPGIEHGRVSPSLTPPSTPPSTSRPPSIYGHSAPIQDSPGLTKDLLPRAAALASSTHGLPGLRSLLASTAGATLFNVRNHALFAAAASDRVSILRFLLREGAQLDHLEPSKHRTALHEACARGSARAVSVLLKADRGRIRRLQANEPDGNDSSLSDAPGYIEHAFRPVRSARLRTNNEPHRCLLELQDDHGDTPLHLAIRDSARPGSGSSSTGDHLKDFAAVVRYILREPEHKFLHLANDDGDTPLHLAAKLGSPLFVSLILAVLGKDQSSEPSDG